jgi:hypothetical protein
MVSQQSLWYQSRPNDRAGVTSGGGFGDDQRVPGERRPGVSRSALNYASREGREGWASAQADSAQADDVAAQEISALRIRPHP